MANNLLVNPIVIDTVMAAGYKAGVSASLGALQTLRIEKIYWKNALNANDELTIVDPVSGNTLLDIVNPAANSSFWVDWTSHPKIWQDFKVSVLGSGTLYIYTR